jgi:hypothetical protein
MITSNLQFPSTTRTAIGLFVHSNVYALQYYTQKYKLVAYESDSLPRDSDISYANVAPHYSPVPGLISHVWVIGTEIKIHAETTYSAECLFPRHDDHEIDSAPAATLC